MAKQSRGRGRQMCVVPGCTERSIPGLVRGQGLCQYHYDRWQGWTDKVRSPRRNSYDTDESVAQELIIFIDNERALYNQKCAMSRNLARKMVRGTYDASRAPTLFKYLTGEANRLFKKEYGAGFEPEIRRMVDRHYAEEFEQLARAYIEEGICDLDDETCAILDKLKSGRQRRNPSGVTVNIGIDGGGYYVEWYRDDDGGSGYGDNAEINRWYCNSHAECKARAKRPPPREGWVSAGEEGGTPYDAATATGMYDRS